MTTIVPRRHALLLSALLPIVAILPGVTAAEAIPGDNVWPSLFLVAPDGARRRVADGDASATLVNLWAHWCAGCVMEIASLGRLAERLPRGAIETLLVSMPENWALDRATLHKRGVTLPAFTIAPETAQSSILSAFGFDGENYYVPRTLLFAGPRRRLVWSHVGTQDWEDESVVDVLRRQIA